MLTVTSGSEFKSFLSMITVALSAHPLQFQKTNLNTNDYWAIIWLPVPSSLIIIICLLSTIWLQVFQLNTNNLHTIGQVGRVFANGPVRPGFNPRSSHTKDFKMVLDVALLNTQYYKVRIKSKVEKGVVPSPMPRCSSHWKRSLRVTLDYSRQLNIVSSILIKY